MQHLRLHKGQSVKVIVKTRKILGIKHRMRINTDEYIFVGFVGFVPKISAENMLPSKTPTRRAKTPHPMSQAPHPMKQDPPPVFQVRRGFICAPFCRSTSPSFDLSTNSGLADPFLYKVRFSPCEGGKNGKGMKQYFGEVEYKGLLSTRDITLLHYYNITKCVFFFIFRLFRKE